MSPNTQAKIESTLSQLAKQSPALVVMLLLMAGFGYFLHIQEQEATKQYILESKVDDLRIEQCHAIQREAMSVMGNLSEIMRAQGQAFVTMTTTLELHMEHIEEKVDALARDR